MKKLVFPLFLLVMIMALAFKNDFDAGKINTAPFAQKVPPKDISSDSAKKMMKFFVNNARKKDHVFTKFNREELIKVLESMTVDTVKFVIGAYTSDVTPPLRNKPVILLQVRTSSQVPGGSILDYFSYLEGSLCPPPDSPPCSALLEN